MADDVLLEIDARFSALEFVLEVMLANELANTKASTSDQFKSDLVSRPARLAPRSGPVDVDELQESQRRTKAILEHFVEKVSSREAEIRGKSTPGR